MEKVVKKILLISSSKYNNGAFLSHCLEDLKAILIGRKKILFIPFARPGGINHLEYFNLVKPAFDSFCELISPASFSSPYDAIKESEAVFVGGGNSFLLLKELFSNNLIDLLKNKVSNGLVYIGSSAGANVAGVSIGTTNDMPIAYPPSFNSLGLIPFNINPHFPGVRYPQNHMGETREQRIEEFLKFNEQPVIALKENSRILIENNTLQLMGDSEAIVFFGENKTKIIKPLEKIEIEILADKYR
jgi:dipeptidase E